MSLGLIVGCFPIAFLALVASLGFAPNLGLSFGYWGLSLFIFWRLRHYPYLVAGSFLCLSNLLPLFFFSFQPAWSTIFGAETDFFTMLIYHLPILFALDAIAQSSRGLAIRENPKAPPLSELVLELCVLVTPWLFLGCLKTLGLDPLAWPGAIYLAVLLLIGRYYARKIMIASITRSEPLQSLFGIAIFGLWIYFFSFVLFYCFRDNRYFSLIYSEYINFNTVAVYYAMMFGGFILLHIIYSADIKEAVDIECKRRQAMDEEINSWFERQQKLRAEEQAAGIIPEDGELASCYELSGLSVHADQADLVRARQYWARRYDPALTGNFSPNWREEKKKIQEIRAALDKIAKFKAESAS